MKEKLLNAFPTNILAHMLSAFALLNTMSLPPQQQQQAIERHRKGQACEKLSKNYYYFLPFYLQVF